MKAELLPMVAVAAILRPGMPGLLWTLRQDGKGWVLPGGGVEAGESPEQAMLREVREEVGLELNPKHVLATLPVLTEDDGDRRLTMLYVVVVPSMHPTCTFQPDEVLDVTWEAGPPEEPRSELAQMHEALAKMALAEVWGERLRA